MVKSAIYPFGLSSAGIAPDAKVVSVTFDRVGVLLATRVLNPCQY